MIAIRVAADLKYGDVNERRVNVDEIKNKYFENIRIFKFGLCPRYFKYRKGINQLFPNLAINK